MLYSDRFRVTETGSEVRWGPVPWYGPTVPRRKPPTTVTRFGPTEMYLQKQPQSLLPKDDQHPLICICNRVHKLTLSPMLRSIMEPK